jgi:hypothetical protein
MKPSPDLQEGVTDRIMVPSSSLPLSAISLCSAANQVLTMALALSY